MAPVGRIDLGNRKPLFGRGNAASGGNRSHGPDLEIRGENRGPD